MMSDAAGQQNSDHDRVPAAAMITLLYEELRCLAAARITGERADHTLTATALVHEVFVRMSGVRQSWSSKAHFFAAASEAMRRVLVDHARAKKAEKRGGGEVVRELDVDLSGLALSDLNVDIEALDAALDALKAHDAQAYRVVMLKFFAGLSGKDVAMMLGVSDRHVKRLWNGARLWLFDRLGSAGKGSDKGAGS